MDKTKSPSQEHDTIQTERWDIDARFDRIHRQMNRCIWMAMVNLVLVAFLLGLSFCPDGLIR